MRVLPVTIGYPQGYPQDLGYQQEIAMSYAQLRVTSVAEVTVKGDECCEVTVECQEQACSM